MDFIYHERKLTASTFYNWLATGQVGMKQTSRVGETLLLDPIRLVYNPEETLQTQYFNPALAFVEATQILVGETHRDAIAAVAPKTYEKGYFDRSNVEYGEMVGVQIPRMLQELYDTPYSRRIVAVAGGDEEDPEERPCAISVQLVLKGEQLNVFVSMRSWDLVRGTPYNVVMWGVLAQTITEYFGFIKSAKVEIYATLPHIYLEDLHLAVGASEGPSYRVKNPISAWMTDLRKMWKEDLKEAPWCQKCKSTSWHRTPSYVSVTEGRNQCD